MEKNPDTIGNPATCRLVAWCLNHYATAHPISDESKKKLLQYFVVKTFVKRPLRRSAELVKYHTKKLVCRALRWTDCRDLTWTELVVVRLCTGLLWLYASELDYRDSERH